MKTRNFDLRGEQKNPILFGNLPPSPPPSGPACGPVYGDLRLQFTANRVLAGGTGKYLDRLCGQVAPV